MPSPQRLHSKPLRTPSEPLQIAGRSSAGQRCLRMPPIARLRAMLNELELKLDAQRCLTEHGRHRYARRIPVERDLDEILQSLQDLIDGCGEPALAQSDHSEAAPVVDPEAPVRIQLKLSPALVRVLQTVRKQGMRASNLVESVLCSSDRIQDTAKLAGIRVPHRTPAA